MHSSYVNHLQARFWPLQTGRNEIQIRNLFAKWRSNVRDYIQKVQRNSSGFPTGSHAAPGGPGIPSATMGASLQGKPLNDISRSSGLFFVQPSRLTYLPPEHILGITESAYKHVIHCICIHVVDPEEATFSSIYSERIEMEPLSSICC